MAKLCMGKDTEYPDHYQNRKSLAESKGTSDGVYLGIRAGNLLLEIS